MTAILKSIVFTAVVAILSISVFPVAAQIAPLEEDDCTTFLGIGCPRDATATNLVNQILIYINAALVLVAIGAVIFLIIAGVRYIISQGDEKQTSQAKQAILYALIGLIVIGLAAAIVNFVIGVLFTTATDGPSGIGNFVF